jgi:formate hydrogenlyase transcriptional activator
MTALSEYHWPGNIRELENFIERAVILSRGMELEAPLGELTQRPTLITTVISAPAFDGKADGTATLQDTERDYITRVLGETNWVIGGPTGAAVKLGMKRTTLQSRMRKLGVIRQN